MPFVKCVICKTEFYVKPSHQLKGWGKYCSIKCRSQAQSKGKFVQCHICKKRIYRSPKNLIRSLSKKFFCTKSCQTIWRNSEYVEGKSANWKNGKSAYRKILERSGKKSVCSLCGISNEKIIVVHHRDHDRTNNKVNNLMWLCLNCHFLVHHDKTIENNLFKF